MNTKWTLRHTQTCIINYPQGAHHISLGWYMIWPLWGLSKKWPEHMLGKLCWLLVIWINYHVVLIIQRTLFFQWCNIENIYHKNFYFVLALNLNTHLRIIKWFHSIEHPHGIWITLSIRTAMIDLISHDGLKGKYQQGQPRLICTLKTNKNSTASWRQFQHST